jgi:hypothetical protein
MCNVYESRLDSVEAGAPGKEIEITPEMIEVGVEAYSCFFPELRSGYPEAPARMVREVFCAMSQARELRPLVQDDQTH